MSSSASSSVPVDPLGRLHHGLHRFAPLLVGHADGGDVTHRGVLQEHGVDLGRVDVHAARDDEVGGAVGEVEVSLVVHVAHVAQCEVVAAERPGRLLRVAVVVELRCGGRLQEDQADLARGEVVAGLVGHLDQSRGHGPADGAGMGQPGPGVDEGPETLRRGVVLDHDGAEPLDEALLDRDGTRRRAVDHEAQRGDVEALAASRRGRASRRWNIVGTMWVCVMPCRSISRSDSTGSQWSMTTRGTP